MLQVELFKCNGEACVPVLYLTDYLLSSWEKYPLPFFLNFRGNFLNGAGPNFKITVYWVAASLHNRSSRHFARSAKRALRAKCHVRLAWLIKRLSCRLSSSLQSALFRKHWILLMSFFLTPTELKSETHNYINGFKSLKSCPSCSLEPRPGARLLDGEKEKKAASELSEGLGGRRGLFPTSSLPFFPSPSAHNFSPLPPKRRARVKLT